MDCSFCGIEVPKGKGKIYVKKDGSMFNFCSSKCEKNFLKLGRSVWSTRWTEAFHKQKELSKK